MTELTSMRNIGKELERKLKINGIKIWNDLGARKLSLD